MKPGTTKQMMVDYIRTAFNIRDVACAVMTDSITYCSFKIGVPVDCAVTLSDMARWPLGVAVRDFDFSRSRRSVPFREGTELHPPIA